MFSVLEIDELKASKQFSSLNVNQFSLDFMSTVPDK